MHLSKRALAISGVATLAFGGSTAAIATVSAGPVSHGIVYGCYATQSSGGSHALVLQDEGVSCPGGETAVHWNQRGPAGPPGPTGPAGATGATGPRGPAGPPGSGATVASLPSGNANCLNGGASVTDGSGNTSYACNGATGAAGPQGPAGPTNVDYGVVQVSATVNQTTCNFDAVGGPDSLSVFAAYQGSTEEWACEITGFPASAVPTVTFLSPDAAAEAGHEEVQFSPGQPLYIPIGIPSIGSPADEFTFMIIDPSS